MRIIIQAMKEGREDYNEYLAKHLPQAEWCFDTEKSAWSTFISSLEMAGNDPCVHLEDDIILTKDFIPKLEAAIAEHPYDIIQFFSMRKADIDVGSRWDRKFAMNQCTYFPKDIGLDLVEYSKTWPYRERDPNGYDTMMNDWLKSRKQKYWIHVPSLVQHRQGVSLIDRRRSSKRQSPTFVEPML